MILGVIQARMSSSRLPGKVMMPILGIPILLFMIDRVRQSRWIGKNFVVATSIDKTDKVIRELCNKHQIPCFCGSLEDVLDRYYSVASMFNPMHIVRLTADCPLIVPEIVDETVNVHLRGGFDYTRTYMFPDGFDTECFTYEALATSWSNAIDPFEREHVCPYMLNHPEKFKLGRYENFVDQSAIKLSVDTEDDYVRIKKIIEESLLQVQRV